MKIYIVSARFGTELEPAMVFKTKEEAECCAHNYIYAGARDECELDNPTDKELDKWAEDNGYVLYDYFYWNGEDEAFDAIITEVNI